MPKELILLNGDGHIWMALDYRNNKDEPAVVYIDNESNEDIIIADSFDNFIGRLYIEEEGLYLFFYFETMTIPIIDPIPKVARTINNSQNSLIVFCFISTFSIFHFIVYQIIIE